MGKKTLETLTETMFYTLMAFQRGEMCGTEVSQFVEQKTAGRVRMGPGTLYTILAKFQEEKLLLEVETGGGRKRTYRLTGKGRAAYREELDRLRACVADGEEEAR